jgi:hypothetical protein
VRGARLCEPQQVRNEGGIGLFQELSYQRKLLRVANPRSVPALVGDVISTVALAGQICREFNVSDHGIDSEIEFKDDNNEATGPPPAQNMRKMAMRRKQCQQPSRSPRPCAPIHAGIIEEKCWESR